MMTRRDLVLSVSAVILAAPVFVRMPDARAAGADTPADAVSALYRRVMTQSDGTSWSDEEARPATLSKSLVALWAKADAKTESGDAGPVEFDPATNSQDMELKAFRVAVEREDLARATVAVSLTAKGKPARRPASDSVVRHSLIREDGAWKIDDIAGTAEGRAWTLRGILAEALKD